MTVTRVALALALSLGCRARHRPEVAVDASVVVVDAAVDAPADVAVARRCLAVESVGAVVRGVVGGRVCEGDTMVTGEASRAALVGASRFEVGAQSEVRVAVREGAALVVGRGVVALAAPLMAPEPARIDTPAGRVIVSSGSALVAVADDGSVRVAAEEGVVTVWPAPEGDAATSVAMRAGEVVTYSVAGVRGRSVRARASVVRAETARWLVARNAELRVEAAMVAVSQAAEADAREAEAANVRLRVGRDFSVRERDGLEARRSLALGRAEARAMRVAALRAQRDS